MPDKLLVIEDLRVLYETDQGPSKAVNGISFDVDVGETIGLVGETGAGKTTTAQAIMRILPDNVGKIYGGKILFESVNLVDLPQSEMRKIRGEKISLIFQDPMTSLNPVLTVANQIGEVLYLHQKLSKKEISNKVDEMLELVGIAKERKDEYPHQFSGGMKQRIVIAIALACKPKLLIADEPTTALDVTIQAQVLEMMNDLKRKFNTAMIFITHDLGVVVRMCEKIAIMYAGEIIEYGTVEDIFTNQLHPYTTGLFGSIPKMHEKTGRLTPIRGLMPDPTRLPKGCKFHPRCLQVMDICKTQEPGVHVRDSHKVKCHLFTD